MERWSWLIHDPVRRSWMGVMFVVILFLTASSLLVRAESSAHQELRDARSGPRLGLGLGYGMAYDPGEAKDFALATGIMLFDYEDVWLHTAPESLHFKIEASLGTTTEGSPKLMASIGGLALYYLEGLSGPSFRPYGEAGVGVIYTENKVAGQGVRVNFNPQIGIGAEFLGHGQSKFWAALRLHHLSNAGLHKDNRGVNSLVLMIGWYFD